MSALRKGKKMSFEHKDRTIIGDSCKLDGRLETKGELVIHGTVEGTIKCGDLETGSNSNINAKVEVTNATINGVVQGEIISREKLTVAKIGKIIGKVSYGSLFIESGGVIEGEIRKLESKDQKLLTFNERRNVF